MTRERQQRKQEEVRTAILEVAREIIGEEGIQGLSIRKITRELDYSPGIVYHYFKDKSEIVETLVREGYQQILASIAQTRRNETFPEKEIEEAFTRYIKSSLESPEIYKAFLLNDDPFILKHTRLLHKGQVEESRTLQFLVACIQRGIAQGRFAPEDPELTAQILWTAAFGLIVKLTFERDVPEEQIDRLIKHHFQVVLNGIMTREEV